MAHSEPTQAHSVNDRTRKACLFGVGPIDVLLMPIAHQPIDERHVEGDRLGHFGIWQAIGDLHHIVRRLRTAPAAIVDADVPGLDRAKMSAVVAVAPACLQRKASATLAAVVECVLRDEGLDTIGHLEGGMELDLESVVQRP